MTEQQYRMLFLFQSAFTMLGILSTMASVIGPSEWLGVALGLSTIASSSVFWALVDAKDQGAIQRSPRPWNYVIAFAPAPLALIEAIRGQFGWSLLLWLVMPAAYARLAWGSSPQSGGIDSSAGESSGAGTQ